MRSQAERLSNLEAYKSLLERRVLDYDPKHPLPVISSHIGQKTAEPQSMVELKRLLAIKEQDLTYSK